jgi:hypothetical protein
VVFSIEDKGGCMCSGGMLLADFRAGTSRQPALPEELARHLTTTGEGQSVVWALRLAPPCAPSAL